MFRSMLLFIFLLIPFTSIANQSLDCVILESGSSLSMELRTSNDFANCFKVDNLTRGKTAAIISFATDDVSHNLSVYRFNSSSNTRIAHLSSDSNGGAKYQSSLETSSLGFKITPTNKRNENKNITVSYLLTEEKEVMIFIQIFSVPNASGGTGGGTRPNPGGGYCDENGICYDPQTVSPEIFTVQGSTQCSPDSEPPSDPEDFDINEHLKKFKYLGYATSREQKYGYLTIQFFPHNYYDLKHNEKYPDADWAFGNWFFGAAAAAIGITELEALRGAAVIQQYQNYQKGQVSAARMLLDMQIAMATGAGDTAGDGPIISSGFKYGSRMSPLPMLWPAGNSCDQSSGNDSGSGGSSGGFSGGWYGSNYFRPGSCWGMCSGGTPVTRITPWKPDDNTEDPK